MNREVVDLCISSEDDAPAGLPRSTNRFPAASPFPFVDSGHESTLEANSPPNKRRWISSSPFSWMSELETTEAREIGCKKLRHTSLSPKMQPSTLNVLSSSPPTSSRRSSLAEVARGSCSPFEIFQDEDLSLLQSEPECHLSSQTRALLADITSQSKSNKRSKAHGTQTKTSQHTKFAKVKDTGGLSNKDEVPPKKGARLAEVEGAARAGPKKDNIAAEEKEGAKRRKEEKRAEKRRQREKEKEDRAKSKRMEREQKAYDKMLAADIVEANKARWDKKISASEMIVDMPTSLQGKSWDTQTRAILEQMGIEASSFSSPLPDLIKWRRKSTKRFDEDLRHWVPTAETVLEEKHVLCLISGATFVSMSSVAPEQDGSLDAHVKKMKDLYYDVKPIYLIEGLETWVRKHKNKKNRSYQAQVRGNGEDDLETNGVPRNAPQDGSQTQVSFDEVVIDEALLNLQVIHKCLVHHTAAPAETAEWIVSFTQHISTIPYRSVHFFQQQ